MFIGYFFGLYHNRQSIAAEKERMKVMTSMRDVAWNQHLYRCVMKGDSNAFQDWINYRIDEAVLSLEGRRTIMRGELEKDIEQTMISAARLRADYPRPLIEESLSFEKCFPNRKTQIRVDDILKKYLVQNGSSNNW